MALPDDAREWTAEHAKEALERLSSRYPEDDLVSALLFWSQTQAQAQNAHPDWSSVRDCLQWWARDSTGEARFYEMEPEPIESPRNKDVGWWDTTEGFQDVDLLDFPEWRASLTRRPEV
jgi:hypothetical protein